MGGDPPVVGTVEAVQAFPVKSLQAGALTAIEVDADGVVGDRRYAVVADGEVVTAETAPVLRQVVAVAGPAGAPLLTLPDGSTGGDAELSRALDRSVRVEPVPAGSTLDAPVHLVSRQALDAAARGEHDAADCACSLEEPRANLVLDLPEVREEQLVGRTIAVGTAVLRVVRRPNHCLGVYAEVARPGRIEAGDAVRDA